MCVCPRPSIQSDNNLERGSSISSVRNATSANLLPVDSFIYRSYRAAVTYAKPRRRSISVASCRKNGNWQIGRIAASQSTSQPRGLLAGNRLRPGGASFYQQIPDESSPITKRYAPRFFFVSLKSAGTMAWFCSFDLSTGSAASVARVFAKIPKARRAVLARVMHGDQ